MVDLAKMHIERCAKSNTQNQREGILPSASERLEEGNILVSVSPGPVFILILSIATPLSTKRLTSFSSHSELILTVSYSVSHQQ